MKTEKFSVFSDPGHSWVKVPILLLRELNIVDKITPYSYMYGQFAYLEEDMDWHTWVTAMAEKKPNVQLKYDTKHTNNSSRVRSYDCYNSKVVTHMLELLHPAV